jgi:flagellar biosynthesis chaperone FliJ
MRRYPLEDLLKIRNIKVDEARTALLGLTNEVASAQKRVEALEKEVAEYHAYRLEEEEQVFNDIKKKRYLFPGWMNTGNILRYCVNRNSP